VVLEHEGKTHELSVPDGSTILDVALDKGIDLPYDCKLGVCMTCPAKLVSLRQRAYRGLSASHLAS
jgi:ferredoxin